MEKQYGRFFPLFSDGKILFFISGRLVYFVCINDVSLVGKFKTRINYCKREKGNILTIGEVDVIYSMHNQARSL